MKINKRIKNWIKINNNSRIKNKIKNKIKDI
jgi:hypothetical protein